MGRRMSPPGGYGDHERQVLHDLVFSGGHDRFTAGEMSGWLRECDVEMSPHEVRHELVPYVEAGMLCRRLAWYIVPVSHEEHGKWRLDEADGICPA